MNHQLLIVTGHDRPGIVSAVSGLLARRRINLEDLRMSLLEGEFAMMVIVRIPDKRTQTILDGELKKLGNLWNLTIFQCCLDVLKVTPLGRKSRSAGSLAIIRVLGKDKTGIVAQVSRVLARQKCNIIDLQCRILRTGSKALYTMVLECMVPPKTRLSALKASLKRIERSLGVEIQVQNADIIQL